MLRPRPAVLLVDDDADTREMYSWSLEARGFTVIGAANAAQAAALAVERHPDALVTDFTLPGDDGFVLAERVRGVARLSELPMVLVSGRAFVGGSGVRALELFDRVLLKPVLPDDLISEIVPLMLEKAAAKLQRHVRAIRDRVVTIPHGSAVGRVLDAVEEVTGDPPPALVADSSARYIGANDAACTLTGRSREELLSLSVWDLTPQFAIEAGQEQWSRFVDVGALNGSYHLSRPEGAAVPALFSASAHVLPDCHLSLLQPLPSALSL